MKKKRLNKVCAWCGADFQTNYSIQIYCSKNCAAESAHVVSAPHSKPEIILCVCQYCGKEYQRPITRTFQKYCSRDCGNSSMRARSSSGRFFIFERDDFMCFYCGKKSYRDGVELHVDHVTPVKIGGPDRADNLVTACRDCNLEKNARTIRNTEEIVSEIKRRNKAALIQDDTIIKLPVNGRRTNG